MGIFLGERSLANSFSGKSRFLGFKSNLFVGGKFNREIFLWGIFRGSLTRENWVSGKSRFWGFKSNLLVGAILVMKSSCGDFSRDR